MLALAPVLQKAQRRDVSERRVTTIAIVERFDVLEHFSTGFSPGAVAPTMSAFVLQTVEKALRGRVDAPMSSKPRRVRQVSENQRIQGPDDVALQASVNFL